MFSDFPDFVSFRVCVCAFPILLSFSGTSYCLIKLEILAVMLIGMGHSISVEI